jgi:hypothetical protein
MTTHRLYSIVFVVLVSTGLRGADDPPDLKKLFNDGIPRSVSINVIYGYADAIVARKDGDTRLDQNTLRLLIFLRGLSGDDKYPNAADADLRRQLSTPLKQLRERPWMLWDRCFSIDAKTSATLARKLLQAHDVDSENARSAGFFLRAMADAHVHTGDRAYLKSIADVLSRWAKPERRAKESVEALLSLAIDADGAARKVRGTLQTQLRELASRNDTSFTTMHRDRAKRRPMWDRRSGPTSAAIAVMCMSRYENTGKTVYRDRVIETADAYLDSLPAEGAEASPLTFGQVITLQLAAYRATSRPVYFDRAVAIAKIAIVTFFDKGPLPRVREGADTLVLAFTELHLLTMQITVVRAPPNTIDR